VIVGLATELIAVDVLRADLARFGEDWRASRWTAAELATCLRRVDPAPGLAARLAAKRAARRALGLAGDEGLLEVEVVREPSGKPRLELAGPAAAAAARLGVTRQHVSLTHLDERALAVVLLEADAP